MKSALFLAKYLEYKGVDHVFELIGGMITHIIDAIDTETNIKIISCHHEQSSGFAAEGYARVKGIPGVALATSGPGATNLITSIGSCYFDSIPTIFITGQVNTYELKKDKNIRQLGFQETDIISIVEPICKSVFQVEKSQDLPEILENAFHIALQGRQGPCVIDIPMNIQSEIIRDGLVGKYLKTYSKLNFQNKNPSSEENTTDLLDIKLNLLQEEISISKKPLLLAGGGCSNFHNRNSSKKIIEYLNLPVVNSLMGTDILPYNHPLRVGFIGSYGNRWANKLLADSDLLITIGSRLDIRQTGSDLNGFCNNKKIWQIDIDENEIGLRFSPTNSIKTSIVSFEKKIRNLSFKLNSNMENWSNKIQSLKNEYPSENEYKKIENEINPIKLLKELSCYNSKPKIYITDVGQHQMWSAQSLQLKIKDRFITSGGMGAMGFGLPAAIGSFYGSQEEEILLISGDGSFQLNIQELETVKRNNIPIKIILFNNYCHGMVRQFQDSYFKGNTQSTLKGYSAPDFVKIAKAYGIQAFNILSFKNISKSLEFLFSTSDPVLLEIPLSRHSNVYPKMAFGRKFGDMEPEIKPTQMEST